MKLPLELAGICSCNNCIAIYLPWDQFGKFSQTEKENAALKIYHILIDADKSANRRHAKSFLHKLYGPYGKALLAAMVARQDTMAIRVWNVIQKKKSWPE